MCALAGPESVGFTLLEAHCMIDMDYENHSLSVEGLDCFVKITKSIATNSSSCNPAVHSAPLKIILPCEASRVYGWFLLRDTDLCDKYAAITH